MENRADRWESAATVASGVGAAICYGMLFIVMMLTAAV